MIRHDELIVLRYVSWGDLCQRNFRPNIKPPLVQKEAGYLRQNMSRKPLFQTLHRFLGAFPVANEFFTCPFGKSGWGTGRAVSNDPNSEGRCPITGGTAQTVRVYCAGFGVAGGKIPGAVRKEWTFKCGAVWTLVLVGHQTPAPHSTHLTVLQRGPSASNHVGTGCR